MLTMTKDARVAIVGLVEPTYRAGVRISLAPSPSNGAGPQLGLELAPEPVPGDLIVEEDGARVFIEESVATLLEDATLDVRVDDEAQQVDFYLS